MNMKKELLLSSFFYKKKKKKLLDNWIRARSRALFPVGDLNRSPMVGDMAVFFFCWQNKSEPLDKGKPTLDQNAYNTSLIPNCFLLF
jgi:hypothetical protein